VGWGRRSAKGIGQGQEARREKPRRRNSSMSERPVHPRQRRLAEWLNPTEAKKEHSLIDKVYKRKNLERA
jgi:hypothetical protein